MGLKRLWLAQLLDSPCYENSHKLQRVGLSSHLLRFGKAICSYMGKCKNRQANANHYICKGHLNNSVRERAKSLKSSYREFDQKYWFDPGSMITIIKSTS